MKNNNNNDKIIIGDDMKKPGTIIISFILCIVLFITEILFMTLFNISHGIKKEEITNIIEQVDIKEELKEIAEYQELKKEINNELLDELVSSQEVENYVKENIKAIYLNAVYNENMNYINSIELKEQINNKIDILIDLNQLTPEQKEKIINILDEITKSIDEQIENTNSENEIIKLIKVIINKKTTNYALIGVIIISLLIIIINQSKTGYIWVGLPTIITGVLFLILALGIEGKIPETGIDVEIKNFIINYLPSLLKTIKKSSIIMTIIGFIGCTLYTILNYQERSAQDGEI